MRERSATRGERFRTAGAHMCLVAAILLYIPLFAAVWQARARSCCDGTQCAAHGHASSKHGAEINSAIECAHPGAVALMDCKISCCEERERPMSAGIVFVLPAPDQTGAIVPTESVHKGFDAGIFSSFVEMPSPPPRT